MRKILAMLLVAAMLMTFLAACGGDTGGDDDNNKPTYEATTDTQIDIGRIAEMPDEVVNYEMYDWKKVTTDMINFVFDTAATGKYQPVVWESGGTNLVKYFGEGGLKSFSVPSYIGDNRMGASVPNSGEGIAALAAVVSASLVGIDMTNYKGVNYVKQSVDFFQCGTSATPENVVLNAHGTISGATFWYELLPNILFYQLASLYPNEAYFTDIMAKNAASWNKAVLGCGGENANFDDVTAYNLTTDKKIKGNWVEPDGAAGLALIMYMSYVQLKDIPDYATEAAKYLDSAKWCMNYLNKLERSPFYEVLTFFAPYLAARMNAEVGTNYNVEKMVNFVFDGDSTCRTGWGVINEDYNGYGGHGLMGSLTDRGGYAFQMNTYDAFWTYIPMVKYDTRFADSIGKWALHAANSSKLFYPDALPKENQSGRAVADEAGFGSFMGYEGLKKTDKGQTPFAGGDPTDNPNWNVDTDFGYGNYHVGFIGSTVKTTNVERILQLDLNATDMFGSGYQSYLYYNPYDVEKTVEINLGSSKYDLFDSVSGDFVQKGATGKVNIKITALSSVVLVLAPENSAKTENNGKIYLNNKYVATVNASLNISGVKTLETLSGERTVSIKLGKPAAYEYSKFEVKLGSEVLYTNAKPTNSVKIDTSKVANGQTVLSVVATFTNGKVLESNRTVRIMNTFQSGFKYDSSNMNQMVTAWNDFLTTDIGGMNPNRNTDITYDTASKAAIIKINSDSADTWGVAASQKFDIDLSRQPIIRVEYADGGAGSLAVKLLVDGGSEWGYYALPSGVPSGSVDIDVMEGLKKDSLYRNEVGYQKTSLLFMPTTKDTVIKIKSLSVEYLLNIPNAPDLGKDYDVTFTTQHVSRFAPIGDNAAIKYIDGYTIITSSGTAPAYAASHYMNIDLDNMPLITVGFKDVGYRYTLAVRFEGDNTIYVLNNSGKFDDDNNKEYDLMYYLTSIYSDFDKTGTQKMQILIGSRGDGKSVTVDYIDAKYPSAIGFGEVLTAAKIARWDGFNGTGSAALEGDKAVISAAGEYGGAISKKFSVKLDKNPYIKVSGLEFSGTMWQAQVFIDGEENPRYFYSGTGTGDITIEIIPGLKIFDAAFANKSTVELSIIILSIGSGSKVKLSSLETGYRPIDFKFGDKLTPQEIHTWVPDISSGETTIVDGGVKLQENNNGTYGGIISGYVEIDFDKTPLIIIDIVDFTGDGTELVGKLYLEDEVNSAYISVTKVKSVVTLDLKEILRTGGGVAAPMPPYNTLAGKQNCKLVLWQQTDGGSATIASITTRYAEDAAFEFGTSTISASDIAKWGADSAPGQATLVDNGVKIVNTNNVVYGGVASDLMVVDFSKNPTIAIDVKVFEGSGAMLVAKILLKGQVNSQYLHIASTAGVAAIDIKNQLENVHNNVPEYVGLTGEKEIKIVLWFQSTDGTGSVTIGNIVTGYKA